MKRPHRNLISTFLNLLIKKTMKHKPINTSFNNNLVTFNPTTLQYNNNNQNNKARNRLQFHSN